LKKVTTMKITSRLQKNIARLQAMKVGGRALDIITLPMPKKIIREGLRLPATYANFYIANTCVLVPTFADPLMKWLCRSCANVFPIVTLSGSIAAN